MKKVPPFKDVDFRTEYPTGHVAEHEVFMSFNGDSQAEAFREWWDESGASAFQEYLNKHKGD